MKKSSISRLKCSSIKKDDYEKLYKYLCWYSLIDGIKTDKKINTMYPPRFTKDIMEIFRKKEINKISKEEMKNLQHTPTETTISFVGDDTKCIGLLRHLRNAIAHDLLWYKGKKFYFEDYLGKNRTAMGTIEREKMYSLLGLIFEKTGL